MAAPGQVSMYCISGLNTCRWRPSEILEIAQAAARHPEQRHCDEMQHGAAGGSAWDGLRAGAVTCRMRSKASRPIISAGGGSTLCARFDASSFSKNCSFVGVCAHDV